MKDFVEGCMSGMVEDQAVVDTGCGYFAAVAPVPPPRNGQVAGQVERNWPLEPTLFVDLGTGEVGYALASRIFPVGGSFDHWEQSTFGNSSRLFEACIRSPPGESSWGLVRFLGGNCGSTYASCDDRIDNILFLKHICTHSKSIRLHIVLQL